MGDTLHTKNLFVSNVFSDNQNSSIEINSNVVITGGSINFSNIPTSDSGLEPGRIWSNNNVLTIVP